MRVSFTQFPGVQSRLSAAGYGSPAKEPHARPVPERAACTTLSRKNRECASAPWAILRANGEPGHFRTTLINKMRKLGIARSPPPSSVAPHTRV
jgi:hypothetical protein